MLITTASATVAGDKDNSTSGSSGTCANTLIRGARQQSVASPKPLLLAADQAYELAIVAFAP